MNLDAINLDALKPLIPLPITVKLAALVAVLLLMCVGYYFLMWTPLQEAIEQERVQVEHQRVLLKRNQRLASNIPKKKEEYKELQKQLKVALNMLPKKSQIPDLLESVTWAGKDSGLHFTSFKPGNEKVQSIYAEVPVSLTVLGTFKQLLTFLKRVGEMPRIVDIKNLSLMASTTNKGLLSISGQAVTYRFVQKSNKKKRKK